MQVTKYFYVLDLEVAFVKFINVSCNIILLLKRSCKAKLSHLPLFIYNSTVNSFASEMRAVSSTLPIKFII